VKPTVADVVDAKAEEDVLNTLTCPLDRGDRDVCGLRIDEIGEVTGVAGQNYCVRKAASHCDNDGVSCRDFGCSTCRRTQECCRPRDRFGDGQNLTHSE
jgi:hypothetical protein